MVRPYDGDMFDDLATWADRERKDRKENPEMDDDPEPGPDHQHEVSHDGIDGTRLHEVREEIGPAIQWIADALHETQVVKAGQTWTIPIHISCGFEGAIVLQVAKLGDCPPRRSSTRETS
jgi:hypothetical protein